MTNILSLVQQKAAKKVLFLPHAVRQMSNPDRMISTKDVRHVIEKGNYHEVYALQRQNGKRHSPLSY